MPAVKGGLPALADVCMIEFERWMSSSHVLGHLQICVPHNQGLLTNDLELQM